MGQIVKRKKKGRPSKADLARRAAAAEPPSSAAEESDVRRSLRRRNVKYTFDFDDYVEDEDFDEEDERRREKKLKVLLKIHSEKSGDESTPSRTRRVGHAPAASASSSESEEDSKPLKKKKIEGDGVVDGDGDDDEIENCFDEDTEVRERRAGSKEADSAPGTPSDHPLGFPLPDKKTLELILDKLQKKDTYGVYAEPVDPEELPDYHDVIEHPMDFGTVRKKLGNGSYTTLEQFESDVLLICSNAMQYNAPDTIYYKQALSIQELAKRKFQRLKFGAEHYEKELKPEQKTRFNSLDKKQIKKPMTRIAQETVASDFSLGATLANVGGLQSGSTTKAGALERLSNVDEYADRIATPSDNNLDKPEDLPSGRGLLSRFGRKPLIHDENRRATYGISTQLVSRPESMFTTFDGEIKQLVAVGLHADHSYARSLARFAGMLGPVAWKVASRRIEQALPPGFKFGCGWVGDYEPLSTPVLMMEKCSQEESAFRNELHSTSDASKNEKNAKTAVSVQNPVAIPTLEEKPTLFGAAANTTASPITSYRGPSKQHSIKGEILEGKNHSFICGEGKPTIAACVNYQVPSPRAKNIEPGKKFTKRAELNSPPPSASQSPRDFSAEKQIPNGVNMSASKSMDPPSRNMNPLFSVPSKQPENNGFVKLPNGKASSNSLDINRTVASSVVNNRSETGSPANYFPHGQEQGLSDPVQLIRRLTENAQKQQKSSNHSTADNPLVPSSRNDDLNNASSAAARAWMSIGAGVSKSASENTSANMNQIFVNSSHSPTQVSRFRNDFPVSGMQFQPMNNSFPIQAFMAPHFRMSNEAQFQNRPPMVFPQLVTADLSRFQMQSPRHGQNLQRQPSQKQETTVPPDLNIGFQSSGSPGRQSSGVQVDSQQPDLALQL